MITLLRVDHRLLHGQVAFSWTQYVGADCILIANDSVPGDELRKTTIKLAKPPSVKLVIKNINDSIEACEEPTYLILTRNTGSSGNKSKQLGIFRSLQVGIEKNNATFYLIPYLWIT
ncbi:putative PTS permease [Klebsiella pneumoniae subsp. ozaenae]|uniref:Putative PTS permease n=1 Tax=Klebsiella pneumoniae subsp. ozaenae TaxID=574 RepID=A0A378ATU6_KLEPO|nr:putative PTS permease [Klebsiella pneumoniae subsp. ozaenae]